MAVHYIDHLPPVIHRLQLLGGMPLQLSNCYALVRMWADHTAGSEKLVRNTILGEIHRLLGEVLNNSPSTGLAIDAQVEPTDVFVKSSSTIRTTKWGFLLPDSPC